MDQRSAEGLARIRCSIYGGGYMRAGRAVDWIRREDGHDRTQDVFGRWVSRRVCNEVCMDG